MKKMRLGRRAVLRGVMAGSAVAVGLPLLECMLNDNGDAFADGAGLDCNFMTWFWGNGVYLPTFEPSSAGSNWQLSESLEPLAAVKDYVNLVTGLQNRCRNPISHHVGMSAYTGYDLSPAPGASSTTFNSHVGGPTVDQLIANKIGRDTPQRAIHVAVDRKLSVQDGGTTMAALSHRGTNQPEYPEHNPQTVWTLLFGGTAPNGDSALRLSVAGAVRDDLKRLQGRLGALDKQIIDGHLEGLNELEGKIKAAPPICDAPNQPAETNPDVSEPHITETSDVMDELIVTAFRCGVTRVASMLLHYGASHLHFHMIGQGAYEHHNNNSHTGGGNWQQRYTDVVKYCMTRLSHLAQLMQNTQLVNNENLLDNTVIYATTDCSNGWDHSVSRQPLVLVGRGRNVLKYPGIHHQASPAIDLEQAHPTSVGNLSDPLLTVLQGYDPTATSVGDLTVGEIPPGSSTPLEAIRGAAS